MNLDNLKLKHFLTKPDNLETYEYSTTNFDYTFQYYKLDDSYGYDRVNRETLESGMGGITKEQIYKLIINNQAIESLKLDVGQEKKALHLELSKIEDDSYQHIISIIEDSNLTDRQKNICMNILNNLDYRLEESYQKIVDYLDNSDTSSVLLKVNGYDVGKFIGFVYDDCHKIYLVKNSQEFEEIKKIWGENEKLHSLEELEECYKNSCPLRFINLWDLTDTVVPQCWDKDIEFVYNTHTSVLKGEN